MSWREKTLIKIKNNRNAGKIEVLEYQNIYFVPIKSIEI